MKKHKKIIVVFAVLAVVSMITYMFIWIPMNINLLQRHNFSRILGIIYQKFDEKEC